MARSLWGDSDALSPLLPMPQKIFSTTMRTQRNTPWDLSMISCISLGA
jgi:hypothetical protein